MPLSWNEIRHRAIQFAHNWAGTRRKAAEKQTFWSEYRACRLLGSPLVMARRMHPKNLGRMW
jgi:hypothetical protein